jgi:uncharacterized alpha/beta hydrolase family protein
MERAMIEHQSTDEQITAMSSARRHLEKTGAIVAEARAPLVQMLADRTDAALAFAQAVRVVLYGPPTHP